MLTDRPPETAPEGARRSLATALPAVPGLVVRSGEPLARYTTFRIGGPAEWLVDIPSQRALLAVVRLAIGSGAPFHLLGLGSNVLIPDEGLPGIVGRLGGELKRARVRGNLVSAGAALPLPQLARRMAGRGLLGLEALSGFPSTVGGAVCMNAGCYGTEIKDVLVSATVVERDGTARRMTLAELEPAYRTTVLQRTGALVTRAVFRLRAGDAPAAMARIDELNKKRWASLPSGQPNAGSIFKNPPGDYAGRLIEACGLKGLAVGGAEISLKHANVIVNTGGASAADVLALMLRARAAVGERFGVDLRPEVVLAGSLRAAWERAGEPGANPVSPPDPT
jgi:UDP-N-acetylmuramate dehydrogenase